jgi:hypothetical protein
LPPTLRLSASWRGGISFPQPLAGVRMISMTSQTPAWEVTDQKKVTLIVASKAKFDLHKPWLNSIYHYRTE